MATNAERIATKVWHGYAIAAARLGLGVDLYRPTNLLAPLTPAAKQATMPAAFDPDAGYRFNGPPKRANAERSVLIDGERVAVGDYLVGRDAIHFVTSRDLLLPISAVICNATVGVLRVQGGADVGALDYGHDTRAVEAPVLAGWPASLLLRGGGGVGGADIPGAPTDPSAELLLPILPGAVVLNTGDAVTDDQERRFLITAAERTAQGWRCVLRLLSGG